MNHKIIGSGGNTLTANVGYVGGYTNVAIHQNSATATVVLAKEVTLTNNGQQINVGETLQHILDKLHILLEDREKHEKYPSLKEAYDNYKLIEKIVFEKE